jgi:TolB-like protein/DNA-binding winged helix-turn-helix (wHTH) protein/Tfp pilus assembly protein PilF
LTAEEQPGSGWIAFDRAEIDLAGRRLFIDGDEVALEPKAFAVLAMLARQPGRAFTRDEILDAVWGHRHVTPGVINRVITLIRQALGETAEQTTYLHTVYGVGYRFDAQVHFSDRRAGAEAATATVSDSDRAHDTADDATESTDVIAPATVMPPAVLAQAPTPAPAPRVRGKLHWPWVAVLGVIVLLAVAAYALHKPRPLQTSTSATHASTSPTLVVLPLRAVDRAQGEAALADGLSEELTTRLAHIEGLSLISQTSAGLAEERKLDLQQLAQQLHVSHAIEGSLREASDRLRIDLRLIEVPGGKTLWAQEYDRKFTDVFAVQSEIAQAVAGALTLRLGLGDTSESDVDIALYRRYLELRSTLLKPPLTSEESRRWEAAQTTLRALAASAPDYGHVHGLLARALVLWKQPTAEERAEAEREAAHALELAPNDTDAHAARAELGCEDFDWDTCLSEYRRVMALDPTDVNARAAHAYRLAGIGYVETALHEFETARRDDPLYPPSTMLPARALDTLDRHDEAKNLFDALDKLDPSMPQSTAYMRWFNAVWRHDYAEAQSCAELMREQDGFRESYLAVTAALQNAALWPQALEAIEQSDLRTGGHYNLTRLFSPTHDYDPQAVFASFESMLRSGFVTATYFMLVWQPEYADLRRTPAFQDYIRRTHMLDYWRAHGFPPQCKPEGDGASCD